MRLIVDYRSHKRTLYLSKVFAWGREGNMTVLIMLKEYATLRSDLKSVINVWDLSFVTTHPVC